MLRFDLAYTRAYALSGEAAKARVQFFALWKGAHPGIPDLKRAKAEYGNLR